MTFHTIPSSIPTPCSPWMKSGETPCRFYLFVHLNNRCSSSWTIAPPPLLSTSVRLFIHTERLTEELKEYLNASCAGSLCVQLRSYDSVRDQLQNYVAGPEIKVWIGTEYTNYALYELITPVVRLEFTDEFVSEWKPVLCFHCGFEWPSIEVYCTFSYLK